MKNPLKLLAGTIFLVLVSCRNGSSVAVTVTNQSGQKAKMVQITNGRGSSDIHELEDSKTMTTAFSQAGENIIKITAVLENGDTLRSQEVYTEGGYSITGMIRRDTIETRYESY